MRRQFWRTVFITTIVCACSDANPSAGVAGTTDDHALASVTVTLAPASIAVGETAQGSASLLDGAKRGITLAADSIKWTSSDNTKATVSAAGLVTGKGEGDVTITASARDKSGGAALHVDRAPVASVAVTVTPTTIAVGESVVATATPKDASGVALTGRVVTWSSGSPGVATVSNTGTITGVTAGGPVSITATSEGKSASVSMTVTPPPNTQIVSLSRDVGSAAGGAVLRITGAGFGASDVVKFGGTAATNVSLISPTTLQATVPAGSVGVVDVSVTHLGVTSTLVHSFEYLPAPTVTFFSSDFEGGSILPFYEDDKTLSISTDVSFAGTHSALGTRAVTGGSGLAFKSPALPNLPLTEPNGLYMRWYIYAPTATVNAVQSPGGQIKMTLFRSYNGPGFGWLMCGIGNSFKGLPFTCFIDQNIVSITGGTTPFTLGDGVWLEIETWYSRKGGQGTARLWINGKQMLSSTTSNLGSDNPLEIYWARFGLVYTQTPTAPVSVYVDNVAGKNGFIDP